ncbi:MAG: DEAD/DEAH box helicase [Spirochaetia bacterium]|nr:DEAD/DEAH box helicase [Spirochaetia bacterium]
MKFSELSIHPDILKACAEAGFETLTEIQEKSLIPATEGKDIAGISQTGTGKTVAFLLPILNKILKENLPGPAALIITPTRELCLQIAEEAERLTKHSPVTVCSVYGGEGYKRQEEELAQNPQIIAATPGRLIDYIKQGRIDLNKLHFLVLDEADRMFDMGFIRDIRYIMKRVPREAQTMLFSATLSYYVMRLASDFMQDPVEVRIESETVAVDKIDQWLLHLGKQEKMPYLINQILAVENVRAIVFTNLRVFVPNIVTALRKFGVHATGLSSMLDQKKRVRLLKDFKLGKYSVLVATDVASRGLDVDDISHVFNYDLPQDAESYVHRIGRTARAGKSGVSVSYCSEMDYESLPRIETYLGKKIPVQTIDVNLLEYPKGDFKPFFEERHPGEKADGETVSSGGGRDRGRGRNRDRDRKRGRTDQPPGDSRSAGFPDAPPRPAPRDMRDPRSLDRGKERSHEYREMGGDLTRRSSEAGGRDRQDPNRNGGKRDNRGNGRNDRNDRNDRDRNRNSNDRNDRNARPRNGGSDRNERNRNDRGQSDNRGGRGRRDNRNRYDRDRNQRNQPPVKQGIIAKILSLFKRKKPTE